MLPSSQKLALVHPRLMKPSLDPDDVNSYRPISNLTFVSKMVERVVARRFMRHVDSHHLLYQNESLHIAVSTPRKRHSPSFTTISSVPPMPTASLVLLNQSSAIDTVDHT